MYSSLFSYNLSRPYPFKWFTPVVVVGGLIAVVLVSLINLATSGYQLVSTSSTNPNVTQSTHSWFKAWPSFIIGQMQASCDSSTIPVGTQLYTNNTALSYTLRGVSQEHEGGIPPSVWGSLVYHNNPLQNCSIAQIQIQIRSLDRSAVQIAQQQIGALLTAFISCVVQSAQGLVKLEMTTDYELVINEISPGWSYQTFIGRNSTDKASLYLGEAILAEYWIQLTNAYFVENQRTGYHLYEGTLFFSRNQTNDNETKNIKSLDYFTPGCYFVPFGGAGIEKDIQWCKSGTVSSLARGPGNATAPLPSIWIPADSLSKALYSTVLADLGQNDQSQPNLLVSPGLLEYFTQNFTNVSNGKRPPEENVSPPDIGLPYNPYTTAENSSTYLLGIDPSTLATSYLCQIPQPKPAVSMICAVLIADMVLLQGLWTIFKIVVGLVSEKKYPEMSYCKGCLEQKNQNAQSSEDPGLKHERKEGYQAIAEADEISLESRN